MIMEFQRDPDYGRLVHLGLAARFGWIDTRLFPAPSSVFVILVQMFRTGELAEHTLISLQRLFFGTLIGGIPALILGIVMGLNRTARAIVDPLISAIYPIPKS